MRKVLLIELYRKYYFSYKQQVGVVWSKSLVKVNGKVKRRYGEYNVDMASSYSAPTKINQYLLV